MRIAINAISITKGGGITVLEKLLAEFKRLQPEQQYLVISNTKSPVSVQIQHSNIEWRYFPLTERSKLLMALWYAIYLPIWLLLKRVDVFFSLTNLLPLYCASRQVLLVHNANYLCVHPHFRDFSSKCLHRLKRWWSLRSIKVTDQVIVQTTAMAELIKRSLPSVSLSITVIAHGPGYISHPSTERRFLRFKDILDIAYVALSGEHKDFPTLIRALSLLCHKGIPVRLHLTVVADKAQEIMDLADILGVAAYIVNHGESSKNKLSEIFQASDVFVFPAYCESFGFPQIEALSFGLPVLTADTPVNREICSRAAVYFPPHDEFYLAKLIECIYYKGPEFLGLTFQKAIQRASAFNWTRCGEETLKCLIPIESDFH